MNDTMEVPENCTDTSAPITLSFITASLSLVFFFVIVVGNLFIVFAIVKDPYGELKKHFIALVGNLACADLIVGIVVAPISFVLHVMEGLDVAFGMMWVRVLHLSYFISCTASLLSITAITIDRHVAIAFPLHYRSTYAQRKPVRSYMFIWVVAVGLPFVYLKVGYIKYAFVFGNTAIAVTLLFLCSCMYIIRKMAAKRSNSSPQSSRAENKHARKSTGIEKRLTKVFSLVLTAYLICYFPSCLMIYLMNFCSSCSCETIHWFRDMQFVLVLLNSCVNPFLYAWQMKAFRNAFKTLIFPALKRNSSLYKFPAGDKRGPKSERSEATSEQLQDCEAVFCNVDLVVVVQAIKSTNVGL